MQNKKLLISSSLIIIFLLFLAVFSYKQNIAHKVVSQDENILTRDYSFKKGKNQKNVSIVEFIDPECESCAVFNEYLKDVYKNFSDEIQITYKYIPNHKNSKFAIKILEASREQNLYNEVLDSMLKYLPVWATHNKEKPELLWDILKDIPNIDLEKIKVDMQNSKIDDIINQDLSDAKKLKVRGTPTIFINGKILDRLSSNALNDAVENEIYK